MGTVRPPYPADKDWVARLHWIVCAMGSDDRDLGFMASLLSHAFKFGDLSERQQRYAIRVVDRVRFDPERPA